MNDEIGRFDPNDVAMTKNLAWLSYLGPLFLIPMLVNKDSAYTKFHVNQGIIWFILEAVVGVIAGILFGILLFNPFMWWIIGVVSSLLGLAGFIVTILWIVYAASGRAIRIPVIGNFELYK